jgi:hypothetical protein
MNIKGFLKIWPGFLIFVVKKFDFKIPEEKLTEA